MTANELGIFALRMIRLLCIWSEYIFEKSLEIYSAVACTFQEKAYVFFEADGTAYAAHEISTTASGSAKPAWAYNPDTKTFYEWCVSPTFSVDTALIRYRLPVLSMEIVEGLGDNAKVAYDLTDFLEKVVVMNVEDGGRRFPSVAQILGAWRLSSHIVLDRSGRFQVRLMTDAADTVEVAVANATPLQGVVAAAGTGAGALGAGALVAGASR